MAILVNLWTLPSGSLSPHDSSNGGNKSPVENVENQKGEGENEATSLINPRGNLLGSHCCPGLGFLILLSILGWWNIYWYLGAHRSIFLEGLVVVGEVVNAYGWNCALEVEIRKILE